MHLEVALQERTLTHEEAGLGRVYALQQMHCRGAHSLKQRQAWAGHVRCNKCTQHMRCNTYALQERTLTQEEAGLGGAADAASDEDEGLEDGVRDEQGAEVCAAADAAGAAVSKHGMGVGVDAHA
eukprot:972219-Pelagomonas_calceolata.AAC.1